jgi:hypothetical protein
MIRRHKCNVVIEHPAERGTVITELRPWFMIDNQHPWAPFVASWLRLGAVAGRMQIDPWQIEALLDMLEALRPRPAAADPAEYQTALVDRLAEALERQEAPPAFPFGILGERETWHAILGPAVRTDYGWIRDRFTKDAPTFLGWDRSSGRDWTVEHRPVWFTCEHCRRRFDGNRSVPRFIHIPSAPLERSSVYFCSDECQANYVAGKPPTP